MTRPTKYQQAVEHRLGEANARIVKLEADIKRLKEALKNISDMPIKKDVVILQEILDICKQALMKGGE